MKTKLSYLLVIAALSASTWAQAQEKKATPPPSREELREQFRNMTPEERAAKMKEWREKQGQGGPGEAERRQRMEEASKQLGLNSEELRNMTPEQRRERMTQAVDKKIAELNKKKADKTISEEETKLLQRLEARKKYMEEHKDGPGGRPEGGPGAHKDGPPGKSGDKGKGADHKDHKDHGDHGKKDKK